MMCLLNPGMRALIVRKTLSSLGSTALVTFRTSVAKESLAVGDVTWYGGSAQESPQYRYSNGSTIVVGGMDKATRIMSSEYDIAYVQEATELDIEDWESISTRLRYGRVSFQQLLADANPSTPTHWLKERCDSGKTRMLNSTHEENPVLFTTDGRLTEKGRSYISRLDALTGTRHLRLRKGLWVAAEGIIYEDFDPAAHIIDEMPKGWEDWQRYWSVDFGFVHPFVVQCWAEDPDGRLYLYRELYQTGLTADQAATAMLDVVAPFDEKEGRRVWIEPKPRQVVTDHEAGTRAQFEKTLGLNTRPANKKVLDGIQAAQRRLRPGGDGRPRVHFLRNAVISRDQSLVDARKPASTIEEIPGYIWDIGTGKSAKEQPVKIDDDGCDAMRYLIAHRDLGGSYKFRMAG